MSPLPPDASPHWTRPAEGLDVLALRTPTLPPATRTNTSLCGQRDVWIVDPATPHEADRGLLLATIDALVREGRRPMGIVLTHHHVDHVGGAAWLRDRLGLAIWAHPETARLLGDALEVDHGAVEDDIFPGSHARDDRWHVLFTPGHAPGHICLYEPVRRLLVAGDMVASVGTIVIAPPEGHMATYLAQLARLEALGASLLVPAHGDVIAEASERLRFTRLHRLEREEKVAAALDAAPRELMEITRAAYTDVPAALHRLASASARAHLDKLVDDGVARALTDDRWALA
ncbi:MAG: MBL fold metallo-hydrolase [Myxococcales bacterium]|nr:MBL fold metallo-hydrolase [Myxococcales bacterium]MCB9733362.1 MBL fold metallo-hydrolase [Deltaproteobacteria bacterium]